MKTCLKPNPAWLLCAALALPMAHAGRLSRADYQIGKTRIAADYRADKLTCAPLKGSTRDICVAEADAKRKVVRAELEYAYTGKTRDQNKRAVSGAEAAYAVAREKCNERSGNDKVVCVNEAKAAETRSLATAKQEAVQKCAALPGPARSDCMAAARSSFGSR